MALIGAVYKWRLDCDSYIYITDYNGVEPLIITGYCLEENSEQNIKDIVATWDERTYCERFNEMVNYVHSFEKWKDLLFLDCNVYLKEYYSCKEMMEPSFLTGIELNLSATSVEYYAQPEATVLDVKCITRDGEKITSYDINFGIPKGIPGLTIKGSWLPSSSFLEPKISELNHGYFIMKDANIDEFPKNSIRGDLYVCNKRGYLTETGELVQAEFQNVGNLLGPPVLIYAKEGVNIDKVGKPTVTVSSNDSGSEYTFTFDYLKGESGDNLDNYYTKREIEKKYYDKVAIRSLLNDNSLCKIIEITDTNESGGVDLDKYFENSKIGQLIFVYKNIEGEITGDLYLKIDKNTVITLISS